MWQRFTERARKVVFYAQEEAGRVGENHVDTEHLLLGLVRENDCVAARILDRLGVSLGRIRTEIDSLVVRGDGRLGRHMQLTARAKHVIDLAYDEARRLNNNYIGTEHLLLGLIREGNGVAAKLLEKLGVELDRARREVFAYQEADAALRAASPTERPARPTKPVRIEPNLLRDLSPLLERAHEIAREFGRDIAGIDDLFLAILSDENGVAAQALAQKGISYDDVKKFIEASHNPHDQASAED